MMNVLITGANGQLGHELRCILQDGQSEIGKIAPQYNDCRIVATDIAELDITDLSAVRAFFILHKPGIVFHCAAMTNVDACESDRESAMRINVTGTRNVALAAEALGANAVCVSTDYVFSGLQDTPYCEWDAPAPRTVYGASKLMGERIFTQICSRSFVVRTSWLYGYQGSNFVKTIYRNAISKGKLMVVNDQLGNPTHAGDLAHHLLALAMTEEYGLYHCTGEGICSWYDFAQKIIEEAGITCEVLPCTTGEFPRPAPRPAYSALRNLMLESTIGNEMRHWEVALHSFFQKWNREDD